MKAFGCGKIRQQDEWYCSVCHTRWAFNDIKPPCAPVEMPIEINSPQTTKIRFRQNQKRAKRFQGYR